MLKGNCVFVTFTGYEVYEALGVGILMSMARQAGHRCALVEVPGTPDVDVSALASDVARHSPDFVGMSLTSTAIIPQAIALGQALRAELGHSVHICAGGPVATFSGERLLAHTDWDFLDSFVRGEGEGVIESLLAAVMNGKAVHEVSGVTVRGQSKVGPLAFPVSDLDRIPWPARDQLECHDTAPPVVFIVSSRGCTGRCTFCAAGHAGNMGRCKAWRGRSPENVVDEIESLVSQYGVDTFGFLDSTYEDPGGRIGKQRVRRIAELILQRGLRIFYQIGIQAQNWTDDDVDLIRLMCQSGLERVLIGVESGSDSVLKQIRKRATVADNRRAIKLFRQDGICVSFGFIMFLPYVGWQDIEDNASFLSETLGHQLAAYVRRLALYPGAEIVEQLISDGLVEPEYHQHLSPYAYRYLEPGIGRMADMISRLFGERYLTSGVHPEGKDGQTSSVFAFQEFDVQLHTFLARLMRQHSKDQDSVACELIAEYQGMMDVEKTALAKFSEAVFADFSAHGKAGTEISPGLAELIEDRYAQAIRRMKSGQLRLGVALGRQKRVSVIAS